MTWLREILSDNRTGRLSSSRAVASLAGVSLSFSTVFLSVASFFKPELVSSVIALGPSLAGLAAVNYHAAQASRKSLTQETKGD